jgi:two-component system heavy metal sensor histidine kinase CusS
MRRLSIRWKLTLWYGGVLAVVLALFSMAVYFTMRHQLLGRIDQGLTEELADVLSEVERARNEDSLKEWLDRRFAHHEGFDFQITRADGVRFFVNARLREIVLPLPEGGLSATPSFRVASLEGGRRWRIIGVRVQGPKDELTVQVARSLASFDHQSRELLLTFLLTGPLTLLLAVAGGYFLAARTLAPVDLITGTARQITAERLSRRIEVLNPDDELGALAQTLNRMIERLERSFAEMQRFTADAAHELRTPLAVIRNEAEVALRAQRSPEEYGRVLENLLEEVNRLSHVAEQLLFLSRQDAGLHPPAREEVPVDELLQEVSGNMQLVAQEKGVLLTLADNASCRIVSDPRRLRRVLYNLLDNAIKYTGCGGRVTVRGTLREDRWTVSIADTGVGIPTEHLPHVFERFYRVDPARTGDGHGAGLGLAICGSVIEALGGSIALESIVGQGTTVSVTLPR